MHAESGKLTPTSAAIIYINQAFPSLPLPFFLIIYRSTNYKSFVKMQYSIIAILAAVASAVSTITETDSFSTLVTVTSCASTVTDCPAKHSVEAESTSSNWTTSAAVSSYEGGANKQYAAGAVALAAGALLAL